LAPSHTEIDQNVTQVAPYDSTTEANVIIKEFFLKNMQLLIVR